MKTFRKKRQSCQQTGQKQLYNHMQKKKKKKNKKMKNKNDKKESTLTLCHIQKLTRIQDLNAN